MIAFSCSACGLKLKVKTQFAGRSSRCPACKQTLTVPEPSKGPTFLPAGHIDGTPSSIAQSGVEGGVTLEQARRAGSVRPPTPQKSVQDLLARRSNKEGRYLIEGEMARGGMGAILRAVDSDLRREVAIKFLLDQADPKKKARFIEEAQITGQLAHPNIVPIYELGVDSQKRLFFSMKKVEGRSLAQVLDLLRKASGGREPPEYSLARLLNVLVNVCHGLAYAHSRGVVHRDLKPANIMLGDFGEVYIMDWGLAKVRNQESGVRSQGSGDKGQESAVRNPQSAISPKVATNRELEADLTQEGAVVGTPVYMPPEQAKGAAQLIDQRSDVYSLGAILYEVLTLRPPIDKEGGYLAVLLRVVQGEIIPPQQRAPERAKKGKVPKELAAVAMKAMAREPAERYQTVEELRVDLERFLDGRSVSAKHDTTREMIWRLVKRNKLASAFTIVLALVLLWSSSSNYLARRERDQVLRRSVPAFLEAAQLYIEREKLGRALDQLNVALDADPQLPSARLMKAQVHIVRQEYNTASMELHKYLQLRPDDADARALAELCPRAQPGDVAAYNAFADIFRRQDANALVAQLYQQAGDTLEARKKLLEVYRKRIEAAWPGMGKRLRLEPNGKFGLGLQADNMDTKARRITDLEPLKGIPLNSLDLTRCDQVRDLGPLKGMPLTDLQLGVCTQVRDLSPLAGLPLTRLNLSQCTLVHDLSPLTGMPLTWLNLATCRQVADLSPLTGMKLTYLNLGGCSQLRDLTPLKGMPLRTLDLHSCHALDLGPLQGMPLTTLILNQANSVRDLTPLAGMPLTTLSVPQCRLVRDLGPLKGMPLTTLEIHGCELVRDLMPLDGMKLETISLTPRHITSGMDVLRRMPSLKAVNVDGQVRLTAAEFWKRLDAGEFGK